MSDSLTLTVQLPQPVLQEAVNAAVEDQVRAHLAAVDLSEIIQRSTAAHLGRAVDEAVIRLLPEKARAQAGEMARNGTLPPPGSGVGA